MSLGGKTCLVVCLFFLIPVPRPASHMLSAGSMCPWAVSSPAKIGPVLWKMEKVLWEEDCEMIGMTWGAFETPGRSTHVNFSPWLFLATSSSGFESGQLPRACSQLGTWPPQPVQASAAPWWPPGPLLSSVSKSPVSDLWETSQPQAWRQDTSVFKTEILRFSAGAPTSQLSRASFAIWRQE